MNIILSCAFILTITTHCYGVSRISVKHSNYTYNYGFQDQSGLAINRAEDGTWKVQSLSNSKPQYSYSSRTTKESFNSDPQRTDSYQRHYQDRMTTTPEQPTPSNRPRPPINNMDHTTQPGVPVRRPNNQPYYPPNLSTTEPSAHPVSGFPQEEGQRPQQGQRPKNRNTVFTMVDDNSNVLVYNSNGLPIYQNTHTFSRNPPYDSPPRPTYQPRPRPVYHPTPEYPRPDAHYPTYYDNNNGGVYVHQSVNTGGPFPNFVNNYVHIPY
ncbi:unnamed protein product [Spodoptera exigua]|nr:unnamed protein product [Spodoptera exigua]